MIQYLNVFFYDIYPYLCGTVFILGSWLRYDYGQYTWRASSSQMLDKRGMVLWSNLFHIGILGIFFGHLFGMLTPHWMYAWFLPIAVKQQMAMIAGGACGSTHVTHVRTCTCCSTVCLSLLLIHLGKYSLSCFHQFLLTSL